MLPSTAGNAVKLGRSLGLMDDYRHLRRPQFPESPRLIPTATGSVAGHTLRNYFDTSLSRDIRRAEKRESGGHTSNTFTTVSGLLPAIVHASRNRSGLSSHWKWRPIGNNFFRRRDRRPESSRARRGELIFKGRWSAPRVVLNRCCNSRRAHGSQHGGTPRHQRASFLSRWLSSQDSTRIVGLPAQPQLEVSTRWTVCRETSRWEAISRVPHPCNRRSRT